MYTRNGYAARRLKLASLVILLALALVGTVTPAAAVDCGDDITTNTTLSADLGPCDDGDGAWALRVFGPATLDLNGHRVLCSDTNPTNTTLPDGILVVGGAATVKNGRVVGCQNGVRVAGTGSHQVKNIVARGNIDLTAGCCTNGHGFLVESNGNQLVQNAAIDNHSRGFVSTANNNKFRQNTASGNSSHGFRTDDAASANEFRENTASDNDSDGFHHHGGGHKFIRNVSSGNSDVGFQLDGDGGLEVRRNTASYNNGDGFHIHGPGNQVARNVAVGNGAKGFTHDAGGGLSNFTENTATDNDGDGFRITEDGDILTSNRAFDNSGDGIVISGDSQNNTLKRNVALGNDTDLHDENGGCDSNVWHLNVFGTRDPASCVE